MDEVILEVTQEADGACFAECLTENIFAQGDSWEHLRANAKEAVAAFYVDRSLPQPSPLLLLRG
jgi:predicted RNase H-like HicB family nuclease